MRKQYTQPEITVLELRFRHHLLQTSVTVTDEETEYGRVLQLGQCRPKGIYKPL